MASKADRRRHRKARGINREMDRQEGASMPIRIETHEDPRVVVFDARARQMPQVPRSALDRPEYGEQIGRAIALLSRDEREAAALWDTFKRLDAADEAYFRRIIGKPRFANVARMEYLSETLEARPDDRPDHRDAATKDRDAVSTWMRWQGWVGQMQRHEQVAIWGAVRHRHDMLRDGRPTTAAPMFVAALRVLTQVTGATR